MAEQISIKPAQRVMVKQQFQEHVDVTPFGLKFLRHGDTDDFALVNVGKIKRIFSRAKNLGDFQGQEVLQIIAGVAMTLSPVRVFRD